ncbi:protein-S-isoprenylcysteine carboxyl O-methyltransferase [Aspergillus neoniger CBS 115656]|uniref:Protein-S-isoprenylcysteine O-methyltransferase n=1 Tax=Aspergillus neoniger (strain CBS 115656) TaxID=1448310 RepID=A0A318YX14_ASPNB|nr:ICMT-domain-containing protein [Aspergillus neoniger CBS 115656]PYH32398.1 ICMT-domain-containing protein [Aspergillus neoniger CBS 115656]
MSHSPPSPSPSPSRSPSPPFRPYRPPPPTTTNNHTTTTTTDTSILPNGPKSLSSISLHAYLLGILLGLTSTLTLLPLIYGDPLYTPLWRIPFFLSSLSLFHFLEYYTTAAYNTHFATVSAYLLTSNGWTYHIAHGSAILECLLTHTYFTARPMPLYLPPSLTSYQVAIGLFLMVLGQTIRSVAMAQAGSNFNHTVQVTRREGHVLVTGGVYSILRHPSYFGFFWWGLGTQLVLGNGVCFLAYAVVLWRFFSGRIWREEKFLVAFFGEEYENYRKRSWVGIPGIH